MHSAHFPTAGNSEWPEVFWHMVYPSTSVGGEIVPLFFFSSSTAHAAYPRTPCLINIQPPDSFLLPCCTKTKEHCGDTSCFNYYEKVRRGCEEREKREDRHSECFDLCANVICWCVRHSLCDILCLKCVLCLCLCFYLGLFFYKVFF